MASSADLLAVSAVELRLSVPAPALKSIVKNPPAISLQ